MPGTTPGARAAYLRERFRRAQPLVARVFLGGLPQFGALISGLGTLVIVDSSTRAATASCFALYVVAVVGFFVFEEIRSRRALAALKRALAERTGPPPDPPATADLPRYLLFPEDAVDVSMLDAILRIRGADEKDLRDNSKTFLGTANAYGADLLFVGIGWIMWLVVIVGGRPPEVMLAQAAVVALAMVPALAVLRSRRRFKNYQISRNAMAADEATAIVKTMPRPEQPFRDGHVVRFIDGGYSIERREMLPPANDGAVRSALRRSRFPGLTILCAVLIVGCAWAFALHPFAGSVVL